MPKVSIIIRCKNEERWIGHTIQSCLDHIKSPEIVIIDNNSSDESIKIAKSFAHDPILEKNDRYAEIKFTKIENYTPGKAINLGVNMSSGEIIMIISSHCVLTGFNYSQIKKHLRSHWCVFGNQTPYYFGKELKRDMSGLISQIKKRLTPYSKDENRHFMHNALSCFNKKTLEDEPLMNTYKVKKIDTGLEIL